MDDIDFHNQHTRVKLDLDEQKVSLNEQDRVVISRDNMHSIVKGVYCNEYKVVSMERILDTACIWVDPSHHTPIQIIQKPRSVTIETPIRGVGALFLLPPDRATPYVYVFDERNPELNKPTSFNLKQGDIMCWVAFDPNYPLIFSETCVPNYSSDRFKDAIGEDERLTTLRNAVQEAIDNQGIEI
jgi:hypothetical protein